MVKRTIVLPLRDNDGRPLGAELAQCEAEMLAAAGGLTRRATIGRWRDPDSGRIFTDRGREYTIVADPSVDGALLEMLPAWCARLRQLALYTDAAEVAASFVGPEDAS